MGCRLETMRGDRIAASAVAQWAGLTGIVRGQCAALAVQDGDKEAVEKEYTSFLDVMGRIQPHCSVAPCKEVGVGEMLLASQKNKGEIRLKSPKEPAAVGCRSLWEETDEWKRQGATAAAALTYGAVQGRSN
ncbi:hypothetical protein EYF80_026800 [Liparis tanakae]|uniref:Uncharacterized protein n=1 Tax=Liparis tanakae TaxID=230148 RepID=A0A4Z2HBI6_9TELE|nr:hypothetical protein EYF80_026800 [Liparis tanakae]